MSSGFLKKTGKQLFSKHLEQYAPVDPLYEQYVDDRGRKKRRKVCISPSPYRYPRIDTVGHGSSVNSLQGCPLVMKKS